MRLTPLVHLLRRVLILRHGTRRVSTTVPESLEATLTFALTRFPSLRPPLHITRDIPEAGGAVEISEEVWKTELIDIEGILILDVHETGGREMSVEKDESNTSDPTPAGPEAVAERTKARTNEGNPLVTSGTSEAAAPLEQAGPVPKSPPVEPVSKTPPPSPPRTTSEEPGPRPERSVLIVDIIISIDRDRKTFQLHTSEDATVRRLLRGIARMYGVDAGELGHISRLLWCGLRIYGERKIRDLCEDGEGCKEDPLVLEMVSAIEPQMTEEEARRYFTLGEEPREYRTRLSRLLNPLPATDPYVP